jgi:hypothetical protein
MFCIATIFYLGGNVMFNVFTPPKSLFEIGHSFINAGKEASQAHLQFAGTLSSIYSRVCEHAWTNCCKASEETSQQVSKNANPGK